MAMWRNSLYLLLLFPLFCHAQATFVAASADDSSSATSATPSDPSGAQEDDVYYGFAWIDIEDGSWSCPTSWTEIDNQTQTTGTGHGVICRIIRGASAPNLTFSYSGSADNIQACVVAFRGADTTTPEDATTTYAQNENDPVAANPAITTVNDDAVVLLFQVLEFSSAATAGAPSGYSGDNTCDTANKPQQHIAYKTVASAGTETPGVWTHTGGNGGDDPQGWTIAIREAAAASSLLLRRRR